MYKLVVEEVNFLREELGKTRDLLGDILKSQSARYEFYEKQQQLMIDSFKFGEQKRDDCSMQPSKVESASLKLNSMNNIENDIPTDTSDTASDKTGGDWANISAYSEKPTLESAYCPSDTIYCPPLQSASHEHVTAQLNTIHAAKHIVFQEQQKLNVTKNSIDHSKKHAGMNFDFTNVTVRKSMPENGKPPSAPACKPSCNSNPNHDSTWDPNSDSPCESNHDSICNATHTPTSARTSTSPSRAWKRGTVLIAGDSMISGLDGSKMSARRRVVVKSDGGCNVQEMKCHLEAWLPELPSTVILHIGTNGKIIRRNFMGTGRTKVMGC